MKDIGQRLLPQYLAEFKADVDEKEVTPPDPASADEEYCGPPADVLLSPEGLPGSLNDALCAIGGMATEYGQQRLEDAVRRYSPCAVCQPPTLEAPDAVQAQQSLVPAAATGRCQAITRKGTQCSRKAQPGSNYCWQHQGR